jgi:putative oxidoreductase
MDRFGHDGLMTLVRRLARPLLASMFVVGGWDSLKNPAPKAEAAEPVGSPLAARLPYLPEDPETLVRINGGVQLVAGTMLALGRFPRLSSTLLAASVIPTTLAGHRFWEQDDPKARSQQQIHFCKNLGLLGGLILAAVDTEGKPGLAWRARHASHHAAKSTGRAKRAARREAKLVARTAALTAREHLPV